MTWRGVGKSGWPISRWTIFFPCASSARARCNTSNADSMPIRVMRSEILIGLPELPEFPGLPGLPGLPEWLPRDHLGYSGYLVYLGNLFLRWLDAEQRGVVLFGEHVQITIRSLPHVADALLQFAQHRLAPDLLPLLVELDPLHVSGARRLALPQAADKDIPLPAGEHVAGIERQARYGDRGNPDDGRLLHPRARRSEARAHVVAAITDDRQAVVLPGPDHVDLVAPVRPLLAGPQLTGFRIERHAKLSAMSHRKDFRLVTRAPDKRIVRRHAAVVAKPQHLAAIVVGILRRSVRRFVGVAG